MLLEGVLLPFTISSFKSQCEPLPHPTPYDPQDRMRQELAYRTMVMGEEMEKWRQQAAMTAKVVMEAKNEVQERKREMDSTKDKMDRLLDKLYVGREQGIELSGAIASNQRMMAFMPGGMFGGGGMMPGAGNMMGGGGKAPKLPPIGPTMHSPPRRTRSFGHSSPPESPLASAYAPQPAKASSARAANKGKPKPDRRAEAEKEEKRIMAMGKRWQ